MPPRPQFERKKPAPKPEELKAIREKMGLSMPQIAKILDVSTRTWEGWEYGERPMSSPIFKLLTLYSNGTAPYEAA